MNTRDLLLKVKAEGRTALLEHEAKQVLESIGLTIPPSRLVQSAEEAVEAAGALGYPVVMKLMSPQALHKTDVGAVVVGVGSSDEVRRVHADFMERFRDADVHGVLIYKMVKKGTEIIVGSQTDETFGPVIMVGPGGVFVEALGDVVFRLCPTTVERALEAIGQVKTQKLLDGFRGLPPVDRRQLAEVVVRLSRLAYEERDLIAEMDLNPIIANEDGLYPVDARIILR